MRISLFSSLRENVKRAVACLKYGKPHYSKGAKMAIIKFYRLQDDFRKINKTLENPIQKDCKIRTDIDIYNPILLLSEYDKIYDYFEWNGLYYFVTALQYMANKIWRLSSHIDVLMSYKDDILQSTVRTAQTDNFDMYYDGGDYQSQVKREIETFTSNVSLPTEKTTILVGVGSVS